MVDMVDSKSTAHAGRASSSLASGTNGVWCNGSILVFGTSRRGSNPCTPAN